MSKSSFGLYVFLCICMCNISRAELKRHRKGKHASLYYKSSKTAPLQENRADTYRTENRTRPVILVGMMVSDTESAQKIEAHRRSLTNCTKKRNSKCEIKLFFFFGRSAYQAPVYGPDIIRGNFLENIDAGKSREWIRWAVNWFKMHIKYADPRSVVIKMDCDTAVRWSLLDALVPTLNSSTYFGHIRGLGMCNAEQWMPCLGGLLPQSRCKCEHCTLSEGLQGKCWLYMQGGFYGISLIVAQKLSECWHNHYTGPEDALFALTIKRCQIQVRIHQIGGPVFLHSTLLKKWSVEEVDVWNSS